MARLFASGDEFQNTSTGVIPNSTFTFGAWFNSSSITVGQVILACGPASGIAETYALISGGNQAGDPVRFYCEDGGVDFVNTSTGFSADTWHHALGTSGGDADRKVYIDGGSEGTTTTSKTVTTPATITIGRNVDNNDGFLGSLAELFVYDVVLNASERTMLALGISPLMVRPASLLFYADMLSSGTGDERDVVGGLILTNTGAPAQAAHPQIYYPGQQIIVPKPVAAAGGASPMPIFTNYYTQLLGGHA